jgi:hypothetical protein
MQISYCITNLVSVLLAFIPLSLKNKVKYSSAPFSTLRHILLWLLFCVGSIQSHAFAGKTDPGDSAKSSTLEEAIRYVQTLSVPDSSALWPNVRPVYLLENLNHFVTAPLYAFENKNTNFCGYTAISFILFEKDPVGFVKFILQLYKEGKATIGNVEFEPSSAIRTTAGSLKYKGTMDINPATQMWYLTFADHFKGYLNIFNRRYQPGDENTMWASTNFAKFNRMLRKMFNWKVRARGADLVRPPIHNLHAYIEEKLKTGVVFLYLNNRLLYKKKHVGTRLGIPTHYVVLKHIAFAGDQVDIQYMDGGRMTLQQISPALLKRIVFGVSWCTNKENETN